MVKVKVTFTQDGDNIEVQVENLDEPSKKTEVWKQGKAKEKYTVKNLLQQTAELKVKLESGKSIELALEKWPPTDKSKWLAVAAAPAPKAIAAVTQPPKTQAQHRPQQPQERLPRSQQPQERLPQSQQPQERPPQMQQPKGGHPQQVRNLPGNEAAWASYNFVSLPQIPLTLPLDVVPGHELWHGGRYSGIIECELSNLTPIYTRDGRGQKDSNDNTLPDFFHLDNNSGNVVIPPRSIKGMIRSVMEILALAPMRPGKDFDSKRYTWRSVAERSFCKNFSTVRAGFLVEKNGSLFIRPCEWVEVRHEKLRCFDDWNDFLKEKEDVDNKKKSKLFPVKQLKFTTATKGRRTEVDKVYPATSQENGNAILGNLVVTGHIDTKKREFVFHSLCENEQSYLEIPEEIIDAYDGWRTDFMEDLLPNKGRLTNGEPIFYLIRNAQLFWLGRARIFRLPFRCATNKFIPPYAENEVTIPDLLMGFTDQIVPEQPKTQSYQGRVSFSCAELAAGQRPQFLVPTNQVLRPHILSGPKPTTFQHYLVQTKNNCGELKNRASYDDDPRQTWLRGRKKYWHRILQEKGNVNVPANYGEVEPRGTELGSQYTQIGPLCSGHQFRFKVRFEDLLDWELGLLTLALQLHFANRPNDQTRYAHKIGMAKPLGLGSVEVKIKQLALRNHVQRYTQAIGQTQDSLVQGTGLQERLKDWQAKFYEFILAKTGQLPGNSANLQALANLYETQLTPIAEFLRMCDYGNAPHPDTTKYMEIEKQINGKKENEYKERPILPSPLDVP